MSKRWRCLCYSYLGSQKGGDRSGRPPTRVKVYRLFDDLNDLPGLWIDHNGALI